MQDFYHFKTFKETLLKSDHGGVTNICWFSSVSIGWLEVFPTNTEKASEVFSVLLGETIPSYVLLLIIGSDNQPSFVAEITQKLAKELNIKGNFHTAYRPQSSGKAE